MWYVNICNRYSIYFDICFNNYIYIMYIYKHIYIYTYTWHDITIHNSMHSGSLRYLSLSPLYNAMFFPSRTLRRPVRTGLLHTRLVPTQCPEKNMTTWKTVYVYLQTRWSSDVICYQSVSCVSSVTGSKCCAHCHAHHCPARLLGPERTVAPVDFKTDPAGRFRSMAPWSTHIFAAWWLQCRRVLFSATNCKYHISTC